MNPHFSPPPPFCYALVFLLEWTWSGTLGEDVPGQLGKTMSSRTSKGALGKGLDYLGNYNSKGAFGFTYK